MEKMEVDDVVDLSIGTGRDSLTITPATARDLRALTQNSGLTITPAPPPPSMMSQQHSVSITINQSHNPTQQLQPPHHASTSGEETRRRRLRPRTEPKSYAECPDVLLLPSKVNGRQQNGNIESESDDDEMPPIFPIKELSAAEIWERERGLRLLREELRNEETKLVLLKKLKQSQHVMKENVVVTPTNISNNSTTNNSLATISSVVKGSLSVTPSIVSPQQQQQQQQQQQMHSQNKNRPNQNAILRYAMGQPTPNRNNVVFSSPRSSLPGGATLTPGPPQRNSLGIPRTGSNLTITPSVTITPTSAPPAGIKPRNVQQNQISNSVSITPAPSSMMSSNMGDQVLKHERSTSRDDGQTPAQRQAAAKLALRKQLEKTLLQIPPPKPPPPEMHFIPNPSNTDFVYLLGLEHVVDYLTKDKKLLQSPQQPFRCAQCKIDFTPVWKWEKQGKGGNPTFQNTPAGKDPKVICEQCVTTNVKKALKQEHTNRLKTAFVKALQQEQEIEQRLATQSSPSPVDTRHSSTPTPRDIPPPSLPPPVKTPTPATTPRPTPPPPSQPTPPPPIQQSSSRSARHELQQQQQQQQQQNPSLFGSPQANANTSLFAMNSNAGATGFGAPAKPAFGFAGVTQPTSLFGATNTTAQQPTSYFGQAPSTSAGGGMFGATATSSFGAQQTGANGTAIAKFIPLTGNDTLMKSGTSTNIATKHYCITAMKEYESKSLEELRIEDYTAGRKGPQAGQQQQQQPGALFGPTATQGIGGGMFGAAQIAQPQQQTGLFGQAPENKSLFGNQNTMGGFGQTTTGFGVAQPASLFNKSFTGATTATTASAFGGFNTTATTANPFGAPKPFGQTQQTTSLFGQIPTSTTSAFSQPAQTGFFGATTQQPQVNTMFGATDPNKQPGAFGGMGTIQTSNPGFGTFGTNTNTSTQNTVGFGLNKPVTNFGFGAATAQVPAVAGAFIGGFGQANPSGGLFNSSFGAKPAAPAFGAFNPQPTQPLMGTPGVMGLGGSATNTSFFGNTAAKPGGLFGNATGQPGSLFGNSSFGAPGATSSFGNAGGAFGANTLGGVNQLTSLSSQSTLPVHQQILALTTSPYGDTPMFRNLKASGVTEDSMRSTNPAAQKAFLESSSNQYKVSPKVGNSIKIKAVGKVLTKKSLFEGLEERDSSVEECFNLTPNAKRLIINKKTLSTSRNICNPATDQQQQGLNVSQNRMSLNISSRTNLNSSNAEPTTHEEFNNNELQNNSPQQKQNAILNETYNRRESWLKTSTFDKVKHKHRMSDVGVMDNTLAEYATDKNKNVGSGGYRSELLSNLSSGGIILNSDDNLNVPNTGTNVPDSNITLFNQNNSSDSLIYNRSSADESNQENLNQQDYEPHPTGIILNRPGYYTIPTLDDVQIYLKDDGSCIVPYFTIGREGYGNVYFSDDIDIGGMNLDEIVFFRNKEVIIYPDDENKPPLGCGLNRRAQITLDQIWPYDKTLHEPIKDPERLAMMNYEDKLRRVCDKHDTKFIEYRPETGSWVFKVSHFSKYGLSDSDEDENIPVDAKKAKLNLTKSVLPNKSPLDAINTNVLTTKTKLTKISETTTFLDRVDDTDVEHTLDFQSENVYDNRHLYIAPTSPTSELAMDIGTDSHKLQLMKASFFVDDEYEDDSDGSDCMLERDSPDQIVPSKNVIHTHLKDSDSNLVFPKLNDVSGVGNSSLMETQSIKSFGGGHRREVVDNKKIEVEKPITRVVIVKPKQTLVKRPGTTLPIYKSVLARFNDSTCISDVAFMKGRKFNPSWGINNSIITLNTQFNNEKFDLKNNCEKLNRFEMILPERNENDDSPQILHQIKITSNPRNQNNKEILRFVENHLEIELTYSMFIDSEDGIPMIQSGNGSSALEDHFTASKTLADREITSVWSLCKTLWGQSEEFEKQDPSSHLTVMCRRDLFAKWLEENVNLFDGAVSNKNKSNYLGQLFDLLLLHKISDACELAFTNDDINLSLFLAQSAGGPAIRQLLQHQLSSWQDVEADQFISAERIKTIMLIAGVPILASSYGTLNLFDNLEWIKCLALHVWYLSSPTSSITDSLLMYEQSFMSEEFLSNPPTPSYKSASSEKKDVRYHLLKLFSKRSHPLEPLLNPETHTADPMDYQMSWLLLQTLESLGYHHCSELSKDQINTSFANQLETYGLWHWAIFVLLHIKDKSRRDLCVQTILYKYILLSGDKEYTEKEQFVMHRLGIPEKWIFWTKAVKAGSLMKHHEQATYLLKAKQWSLAHSVIMEFIVPDAIVNDNISYLQEFLDEFEDHRHISNWPIQGQVIIDYIEINEKFEKLKTVSEHDLETYWEELKPQLAELCSRILLFPCPTAKHRLCQSEIAQKLACLVRGILLTTDVNPCLVIKVALEKLPLPQEFAQQELRVLLDTYFAETERHMMDI